MGKLSICIDIDGTMTYPDFLLEHTNKHYNKNVTLDDLAEQPIYKAYGVSFEEYFAYYISVAPEILRSVKPREGVREILRDFERKHELHYITAREDELTEATNIWFETEDIPRGTLHIMGSHHKSERAKEVNCDVFIEDRYDNAIELAEAGFRVLLIDCVYNRKPLTDGIVRVYSWEDIKNEIEKYEKEVSSKKDEQEIA